MEKQITVGELSGCPKCGCQPRLYLNLGAVEYHFECQPCRFRMWARPTAQEAVQDWEALPRIESTPAAEAA